MLMLIARTEHSYLRTFARIGISARSILYNMHKVL